MDDNWSEGVEHLLDIVYTFHQKDGHLHPPPPPKYVSVQSSALQMMEKTMERRISDELFDQMDAFTSI